MNPSNEGTHRTHCCVLHGCKYGDENCPVESGVIKQDYVCESCDDAGIKNLVDLEKVLKEEVKTCPYCHHIIS